MLYDGSHTGGLFKLGSQKKMRASAAKCVKKTLDIFLPEALIATPAVLQKRNKLACVHFFARRMALGGNSQGWPGLGRRAELGRAERKPTGLGSKRPRFPAVGCSIF